MNPISTIDLAELTCQYAVEGRTKEGRFPNCPGRRGDRSLKSRNVFDNLSVAENDLIRENEIVITRRRHYGQRVGLGHDAALC
jgi:hypothetical protein